MEDLINLTEEEIQYSVTAAFHSVNLINQLNGLMELTEEEQDRVNRNIEHLRIMMVKDWFSSALTEEQTQQINAIILS